MSSLVRPVAESLSIAGPVGNLEAILETPVDASGAMVESAVRPRIAVICHPHPLYGGTMTNKVVHMLAKACNELGVRALRFNYRGVGASAGKYDEGNGETDDAVAVVDWALSRWPGAELWLGGFSFGGGVAIRTAVLRNAIKRRLREQFRLRRHALPAVDYMVRLTAVVSLAELDGIVAEWLGALEHDLRKSGATAIPQATTVTSGVVA